jgi:hypothetical protein
MTFPEPDRTIRAKLIDLIRAEAANVEDDEHPEYHVFALHNEQYRGVWQDLAGSLQDTDRDTMRRVVREVAQELMAEGVLLLGKVGQAGDWGLHGYQVSFTRHGLAWARGTYRLRTNPHEILEAVEQVHQDWPETVKAGCVALVAEAVDCIEKRCFRAAVVLVGVAAEEATTQLMECLCGLTGYTAANGWSDLNNRALAFARRWAGARQVLAEVKERIKVQLNRPRPDWWSLWEGLPESLVPLAEAVRVSRNTAAHDADHQFTYLKAATLLCGLPHQLRWIAEIQDHIQNPRNGVKL